MIVAIAARARRARTGSPGSASPPGPSAETEVGALVSGLSPERIALANWAHQRRGRRRSPGSSSRRSSRWSPAPTRSSSCRPSPPPSSAGSRPSPRPSPAASPIGMLQAEAVFLQNRYDWFPELGRGRADPARHRARSCSSSGAGRCRPEARSWSTRLGRAPRPHSRPDARRRRSVPLGVVAIYVFDDSYRQRPHGIVDLRRHLALARRRHRLPRPDLPRPADPRRRRRLPPQHASPTTGASRSRSPRCWPRSGRRPSACVVGLPALRIRGMLVAVVTLTLAVALEARLVPQQRLQRRHRRRADRQPVAVRHRPRHRHRARPSPGPSSACCASSSLVVVAVGVARLRTQPARLGDARRAGQRAVGGGGRHQRGPGQARSGSRIGAFIAGLGGCLLAYKQTNVTFESFSALLGLALFATAFLAGITSVSGGLVAGVIAAGGLGFVFLERSFDVGRWYGVVSGIGLILAVILNPDGLVGPAHAVARAAPPAAASRSVAADAPADPARRRRAGRGHRRRCRTAAPLLVVDGLRRRLRRRRRASTACRFDVPRGLDRRPHRAERRRQDHADGRHLRLRRATGLGVARRRAPSTASPPHRRARQGLGRTFQGVDLYDDLTVEENVMVGQYTAGGGVRRRSTRCCGTLGLEALRDRNVRELSQGQRQLVSIARALAERARGAPARRAGGRPRHHRERLARRAPPGGARHAA